jgi:hypothetical protein
MASRAVVFNWSPSTPRFDWGTREGVRFGPSPVGPFHFFHFRPPTGCSEGGLLALEEAFNPHQ